MSGEVEGAVEEEGIALRIAPALDHSSAQTFRHRVKKAR